MNNLISVIIPSYNRKDFLKDAIDSVLKQNYKNIEIIIVDDCSNDGTKDMINRNYNNSIIKFHKNEKNSGAGFSRRVGYEMSKGDFVVFMDDDDYYTNFNFFADAIKKLHENENISFVSSSSIIEYVSENKKIESIMNIKGEINNSEYLSSFQRKIYEK